VRLQDAGRSSYSSGLASASDSGEAGWPGKFLPQRLACASDGGAGWPDVRW
jgi:hypothetical protein